MMTATSTSQQRYHRPTHLQFGLCVFFLKNKHFTISGQNVERAPFCNDVNNVIELCAVGNELVIQIIDDQKLFVR